MTDSPKDPEFQLAGREKSIGEDIEAEIRFHLDAQTALLIEQGWRPEEAREEAKRRFGSVERTRLDLRDIDGEIRRRRRVLESAYNVLGECRVAWRSLRRSPGYTLVVVGTLGLAIGANATMFGLVDRLLLRPPSGIADPEAVRRVTVARWSDNRLTDPWDAISYPAFTYLRDNTSSFLQVAAAAPASFSVETGLAAKPARGVLATGSYFGLLGAIPRLGRFFTDADDQPPGGRAVVVVGEQFWRQQLGGEASLIGQPIRLNGKPFEVIGIARSGFTGTDLAPVDLWVPIHAGQAGSDEWQTCRGCQFLNAFARLKPGVELQRATADATRGYQLGHADHGPFEAKAVPTLNPLTAYEGAPSGAVAAWLFGVTLMVLLIACANVANIVLARGLVRGGEAAIRQALGVSRWQLARQLAIESVMVSTLGAALGLAVAAGGSRLIRGFLLPGVAFDRSPIDARVLLVTAAVTIAAAVTATFWPMVRATRLDLAAALHGAGRATGFSATRIRAGLLLTQTTLSTALVIGAGLFVRSVTNIERLDLGIEVKSASLVSVELSDPAETNALFERALPRIRALPGVTAAGATAGAPFRSNWANRFKIPGRDSIPRLEGGGPYLFAVTPGMTEGFGFRLLRGRTFSDQDRLGSPPVAIISERMASLLWPGQDPIGRCFISGADSTGCREIVGIVADIHRQSLDEAPFMLYLTVAAQDPEPQTYDHIVFRSSGPPERLIEPIRRILLEERADLPFVSVTPLRDLIRAQARAWNLGASMFSVFGTLSLVIAAVGLYGVIAFAVSQRRREIGIRAALGADSARLVTMVVGGGLAFAAIGVTLGLALALMVGRRIEPLLFHTSPRDGVVLGTAAALVLLVGWAASVIPARRAARVSPAEVLRTE
jgi:predicted permease